MVICSDQKGANHTAVLQEYKCPCCGGAITFDSGIQKMKCPFCDTEFEMKAQADDYVTPGSLQITKSRDFHLYTHLDRREKPKSSSGGSSTHTSSSGTTHGGGGGKF